MRSALERIHGRVDVHSAFAPLETATGVIVPLRVGAGSPLPYVSSALVLKCAFIAEESIGMRVQHNWHADCPTAPVAPVLWLDGSDVACSAVMYRADTSVSLGFDSASTTLLCERIAALHDAQPHSHTGLFTSLSQRFASLLHHPLDGPYAQLLRVGAEFARELLAEPLDVTYLHGDAHHGNLLYFGVAHDRQTREGARQWKFIDFKGLHGESTFDYCNLMFNPQLAFAARLDVFTSRLELVVHHLEGLHNKPMRERYLRWLVAYGCLSAAWHQEDDNLESVEGTLAVVRNAVTALEL
ncbi:aminoglycoside phosphotransferase family protein [Timonella sp. A28]|uniref:aminoglycoside phosphotransferase family protein n=1 Tax=Timonella sp. A28 TaxID=3442640 RepID=UPI003EB7CB2F